MRLFFLSILLFLSFPFIVFAVDSESLPPDPLALLKRADENLQSPTVRIVQTSINDGKRIIRSKIYTKNRHVLVVFLFPPNSLGNKSLRSDSIMIAYSSKTDALRIVPPSVLLTNRQGSALYVDDLTRPDYLSDYHATFVGTEKKNGYDTYVLRLDNRAGKSKSVFYARLVYLDTKTFLPIYQELYSRDGRLMKTVTVDAIGHRGEHSFAEITSHRLPGDDRTTTYTVQAILFDAHLSDLVFSKMMLNTW